MAGGAGSPQFLRAGRAAYYDVSIVTVTGTRYNGCVKLREHDRLGQIALDVFLAELVKTFPGRELEPIEGDVSRPLIGRDNSRQSRVTIRSYRSPFGRETTKPKA